MGFTDDIRSFKYALMCFNKTVQNFERIKGQKKKIKWCCNSSIIALESCQSFKREIVKVIWTTRVKWQDGYNVNMKTELQ